MHFILDFIIVANTVTPEQTADLGPLCLQCRLPRNISRREGAQWLSGRVLDSRPRGHGFKPHRRHCVVVFEQDSFILA